MVVRPSIGGDGLRSPNLFGPAPVTFDAVTAGPREVTFGGRAGVTVAAGGFAVSDPVPSFPVVGGTDVVVGLSVVG